MCIRDRINRCEVSRNVEFSASCSIGYPRYRRIPASPSIYVIADEHDAVLTNPGSRVTRPVSFNSFEMSYPSLPSVDSTSGHARSVSPVRKIAPALSLLMKMMTSLLTGSIAGVRHAGDATPARVSRSMGCDTPHNQRTTSVLLAALAATGETLNRRIYAFVGGGQCDSHMAPAGGAVEAARRDEDAQVRHLVKNGPTPGAGACVLNAPPGYPQVETCVGVVDAIAGVFQ